MARFARSCSRDKGHIDRSVTNLARQRGIELPIIFQLYRILFEGKPPRDSLVELLDRIPMVESAP